MQVGVKNLKLVDSQSWDLMREGEAEKQVFFLLHFFFCLPHLLTPLFTSC